ncbi:ASCH domain-containing protein [Lacticaseibacillus sp. 53-4]|uniref:ASCH domain-containing protein n=1 Tax=Lacticaseibacillus sp. 53-4 TaxID=2799575 RepID=UPI0019441DFF|nr:ASCH domain-containing protein [Lacticaseibacillus sp. 53-4]
MNENDQFFQRAIEAGVIPAGSRLTSAYAMGDSQEEQDDLAALVLAGTKTATSSGFEIYAQAHEPLPQAGNFDIIQNSRGEPVALIATDHVEIRSFARVDEAHAFREGEGDRSLPYWRKVHLPFFTKDYQEAGLTFDPARSMVVLESFHVIYPH